MGKKDQKKRKQDTLYSLFSLLQIDEAASFQKNRKTFTPGAIKSRWLVDPGLNAKLDIACAYFIHALGLTFSTTEEHCFKHILDLTRQALKSYKPPGCEKVRGSLLNANYDAHKKRATKQMQDQAE
eukprot:14211975-Ditylum_brightwellii.AAC.1